MVELLLIFYQTVKEWSNIIKTYNAHIMNLVFQLDLSTLFHYDSL
jgi:hypothetical protein